MTTLLVLMNEDCAVSIFLLSPLIHIFKFLINAAVEKNVFCGISMFLVLFCDHVVCIE